MEVKVTPVFRRNLNCNKKVVVNRGGARSSKSYSICQLYLSKFMEEKCKKLLVLRKTLPSLRISTLQTFESLTTAWNVKRFIQENKSNLDYRYKQNYLHFGSVDDVERYKSTEWNYIFLEEATEFTYEEYQVLKMRLSASTIDGKRNQMHLAFNPTDEFCWIKEKVLDKEKDCEEILSTYKDNPFLSEDYKEILYQLENQDRNLWRIYALGEWGRLEQLIYSNYEIVDNITNWNENNTVYGVDFGFNSPCALVKCEMNGVEVKVEELLYRSNLTNADLIKHMKVVVPEKAAIYCDGDEAQRIEEFRQAGFVNAKKANKKVNDGIDFCKRLKFRINSNSENLKKEIKSYSWRVNKQGIVLDEPVKFMDHLLDGVRYALFTHYGNISKEFSFQFV